jgi:adenosine deaminase CECR1
MSDQASDRSSPDPDAEWARKEGLPSIIQPFIQKYLDGRDALVAQEKRQRSDHVFRETLSPMATEADAIVSAIRFEEQQTIWQPELENELAKSSDQPIYPGMMFSLAKERMESSKLWQIVKKMPKGALLHCHLDAMGDIDWLVETAFSTPGICISAVKSLHTAELREDYHNSASFKFTKKSISEGPNLWSEEYKAGDMIPIAEAADSFPDGGKEGFKKWMVSRMTLSKEDTISHHLGPNDVWARFISCFRVLVSLHHYEPIFRGMIRGMLKSLHEDGVKWVDIRHAFVAPFYREGSETPDEDFSGFFKALHEEIEAFKASEEGKGFWGAKMIWTTIRHGSPRDVVQDMKNCLEMKAQFPDLILGYDLVGQEDLGRPLVDLLPELFWFKKRCAEEGVDIPFYFHAGETLGDGDTVDENLFDAILLGTRRIGHGISLQRHPLLIEMVKDKKILIESCPVSNEILRYTGSIMMHPLPGLLARGVSCALSNDDPAILGQGANGMSHDFWQALQGWENLGLAGLASLAENSVRWATYEECTAKEWQQQIKDGNFGKGIRAQRMREWAQEFEKFCQWVVLEYGADQDPELD